MFDEWTRGRVLLEDFRAAAEVPASDGPPAEVHAAEILAAEARDLLKLLSTTRTMERPCSTYCGRRRIASGSLGLHIALAGEEDVRPHICS